MASPRATLAYILGLSGDRLRFTIAHELGHALLHTRREVVDEKEREREANLFAGAFLLPAEAASRAIAETLTLHGYMRIKASTGMSLQAIIMRGHAAGLISAQRKKSLMIQISTRGWRKDEPVTVGLESPMLLWTELTAVHGDSPYFAASQAYVVPPRLLEQWIPTRTRRQPEKQKDGDVIQFRERRSGS